VQHSATAEDDTSGGAAFEKITACGHDDFLPMVLFCSAECLTAPDWKEA
jgi:hypothetical protein